MSGILLRAVLGRSLAQIRHVTPVRSTDARGLLADVYAQMVRDFGMLVAPLVLHSPAPVILAANWTALRETFVADGLLDREIKEIVAAEISAGNSCPYCVTVHTNMLETLDHPGDGPVRTWARACATARDSARHPVPVTPAQLPELIGTVVVFHYTNRMVNVFLPDNPVPNGLPGVAQQGLLGVVSRAMGVAAQAGVAPGDALSLLPPAPPPPDLAWAAANPTVSDAFARAFAVIDDAAARSVPEDVRSLLGRELAAWQGESRGPGRGWATDAVSALPEAVRPAALLALLTAFASYQVDKSVIADYRRRTPDDQSLLELTSWAAQSAARRAVGWIRTTDDDPARAAEHVRQP